MPSLVLDGVKKSTESGSGRERMLVVDIMRGDQDNAGLVDIVEHFDFATRAVDRTGLGGRLGRLGKLSAAARDGGE